MSWIQLLVLREVVMVWLAWDAKKGQARRASSGPVGVRNGYGILVPFHFFLFPTKLPSPTCPDAPTLTSPSVPSLTLVTTTNRTCSRASQPPCSSGPQLW